MKSGVANIYLQSTGAGTSGLGITPLASQLVNVQAQVNNYAVAELLKLSGGGTLTMTGANQFTLDLGATVEGQAALLTELGVKNDVAAPADSLAGSFGTVTPGFLLTGFAPFSGLAAGTTHGGLNVQLLSTYAGTYMSQFTISPKSTNPTPFTLNLPTITINLTGRVHIPGDFNFDGYVDAADYVVWRKGLGTTYTQSDFDVWRANFGRAVPGAGAGAGVGDSGDASTAVPEPSAILLAILGLLAALRQRVSRS
jgi:hypothetical protein